MFVKDMPNEARDLTGVFPGGSARGGLSRAAKWSKDTKYAALHFNGW